MEAGVSHFYWRGGFVTLNNQEYCAMELGCPWVDEGLREKNLILVDASGASIKRPIGKRDIQNIVTTDCSSLSSLGISSGRNFIRVPVSLFGRDLDLLQVEEFDDQVRVTGWMLNNNSSQREFPTSFKKLLEHRKVAVGLVAAT